MPKGRRYTDEEKKELLGKVEALRKQGLSQLKAINEVGLNKASYHAWSVKKIRKPYTKKKVISVPLTENLGASITPGNLGQCVVIVARTNELRSIIDRVL